MLVVLGLVLALDYADRSVVGAAAPSLKHAFHIGNTELGALASAFSIVGALCTLPAGVLVDRVRRTTLLAASIGVWAIAMGLTGAAISFLMLILARLLLGVVTATARPAIISLAGDAFGTKVRGKALGVINAGELVGTGIGLILAAVIVHVLSWRALFWLLGLAGAAIALFVARLDEPPRSRGRLKARAARPDVDLGEVEPDPTLILSGDQARMPLWEAVRYVLRVRTNLIVIVSSSLGHFFFAGVRTFAVVFVVHQYRVREGVADVTLLALGIGAVAGMLAGGRLSDKLLGPERPDARLLVGSAGYVLAAPLLLPALLVHSLPIAVPFIFLAGVAMSVPAAPLDAVRLEVIHPQLWGRAEGTRNVVQIVAEALAPITFGYLADTLAGGGAAGTQQTFLIMLAALAGSGLVLLAARRRYPIEAASAARAEGLGGSS